MQKLIRNFNFVWNKGDVLRDVNRWDFPFFVFLFDLSVISMLSKPWILCFVVEWWDSWHELWSTGGYQILVVQSLKLFHIKLGLGNLIDCVCRCYHVLKVELFLIKVLLFELGVGNLIGCAVYASAIMSSIAQLFFCRDATEYILSRQSFYMWSHGY
jgi:hypothetical protein